MIIEKYSGWNSFPVEFVPHAGDTLNFEAMINDFSR